MFVFWIILVKIVIFSSFNTVNGVEDDKSTVPFRRYCSQALHEVLKEVCGNKVNAFVRRNRSIYRKVIIEQHLQRLIKRDIAKECCRRPCGREELERYCEEIM